MKKLFFLKMVPFLVLMTTGAFAQFNTSTPTNIGLPTGIDYVFDVVANPTYNRLAHLQNGIYGDPDSQWSAIGVPNLNFPPANNNYYGFFANWQSDRAFFGLRRDGNNNNSNAIIAFGDNHDNDPVPNRLIFQFDSWTPSFSKEVGTMLANGNVGFGTSSPLHKLHVNDGALMLSGAVAGFGGPQLLFSDNVTTHPNGRWAIEYITATPTRPNMGGLNFWTPFNAPGPSGTAGNYSLFLKDDGKIGMGVTDDSTDGNFCATALPTGYRLYVNGGILTTKVKVANYCSASWADYVFSDQYQLLDLYEVENFIKANNHLPNIPSAEEIEKEGLDLADMQSKQMAKIEELTLYMIEMKKQIDILKTENAHLKKAVELISN